MMKYFSTVTKKAYDTPEELKADEAKVTAEEEAKKNKEKQKDDRLKEVWEAYDRYLALEKAFVEDYGTNDARLSYSILNSILNR